ncbi:ACP S-malonyltransferase [Oryzomonas sagensis]|uniref:[acyl-carrier-protein] S-malonyltransferase n=1 Tax=Oryzomonas sagensis TaxID=2603857 RepID=A0ABQ6TMW0_9BACT|nr:acyltransferase domain-containing protein [Oryzomonas sagensis]KAB0669806.1 ACP S-malonyltransferase [Oryzomonas sagensis]
MICFMFPGQPLAHDAILPCNADFSAVAALARAHTGLDLATFTWPEGTHTEQVALQVYGVAVSLYRQRCLRLEGVKPALAAEHSMGIYAALAACGSVSEGEALEIAFRVGACMEQRFLGRDYALGCLVGLTAEKLAVLAAEGAVFLANHNTSHHFLLAGRRHDMEATLSEALAAGAFSAKLFPCDAPLHTPLLAEAEEELTAIFRDYRYREPAIPLMNHIDQEFLTAAEIPSFLMRELTETVHWEQTYRALKRSGAARFVEVGAGDSLKKYNRWIESRL